MKIGDKVTVREDANLQSSVWAQVLDRSGALRVGVIVREDEGFDWVVEFADDPYVIKAFYESDLERAV